MLETVKFQPCEIKVCLIGHKSQKFPNKKTEYLWKKATVQVAIFKDFQSGLKFVLKSSGMHFLFVHIKYIS